jgi:membrane protein
MVEQVQGLGATLKAGWTRTWHLTVDLWHELAQAVPVVGRVGSFTFEVIGKYHKDDCLSYAAGLSFWLIVSLVPMSTLFFKLLGAVLGSRAYGPGALRTLQEIVPYLPGEFINDALANSQKIGGMGLSWFVLLFGSYWCVSQLDTSLAHVFGLRIKKHRQTRKNNLLRQVIFLVGGLLTTVFFLAVLIGGALRKFLPAKHTDLLPFLAPLVGLAVMTMVLQYLPRQHVRFRHAFLGAAIATVLWWLARWGFGVYLRHTMTWGIMYGSLLGIVAGLTFLYYSCAILLLGAEITAAFYRQETGGTTVPPWLRVKAGEPAKPKS